jgi:hypothetical protein
MLIFNLYVSNIYFFLIMSLFSRHGIFFHLFLRFMVPFSHSILCRLVWTLLNKSRSHLDMSDNLFLVQFNWTKLWRRAIHWQLMTPFYHASFQNYLIPTFILCKIDKILTTQWVCNIVNFEFSNSFLSELKVIMFSLDTFMRTLWIKWFLIIKSFEDCF